MHSGPVILNNTPLKNGLFLHPKLVERTLQAADETMQR